MPINPTIKDQIIKNNPVGILFFLIFPFLFEQHDIWHHSIHPFDFSLLIGLGMAIYTLLSWIYVLKTSSGPDINTKFIILSSVTGQQSVIPSFIMASSALPAIHPVYIQSTLWLKNHHFCFIDVYKAFHFLFNPCI